MRIDEKAIQESELAMSRARQMAARPGSSGFGFEANSPAELKQGLALMKRQLQDMEAHRRQYELALQNGFVIAGFGGNLDGIEVPETLMTGEVPAGMTPEQALDEVIDYMRKTIAALSTKLGDKTTKAAELPKRSTKYLEKRIKEDRSLGRTPKPFDAVSRGTTVLEKDGEPWTVIEKGTVGELNRKYPECEIFERSYYHAVYVGDGICYYGHEDRGKHIFVYGEYEDVYNNVLAYYDDGPSRSWSVYMKEAKNLKEDVAGFTFKELTKKTWDEYIKDALEKLKAKVEDYEDEDKEDVAMILENIIDDATEVADGSFETYQELAILHLFEEKFDDLESLNKALKAFGIKEIKNDEMDESVITDKKDLKESEGTYLRTFFKFDDMLDENGELKQVDEVTDWLQELIDCNYLDNMWGVWFEDYDDTAAAAGIEVKTMPDILAEDPEAQFGYSYGSPDTRLCLENAVDYVREDGCDDWEHFGIKSPDDDDYYDEDDDDYYGDDEEYDLDTED